MGGSEAYVLAGFDGRPASVLAVRWAAAEARLRGLPLIVCHAWYWPYPVSPPDSATFETIRRSAHDILDKGLLIAREVTPRARIRGRLEAGPVSAVLVNLSQDAALTVVGRLGEGGVTRPTAATSAARLPSYAHCPVVVVRDAVEPGGPVVVGVDGSPGTEAALAFGFEEAALREVPLRAVHAYGEPAAATRAWTGTTSVAEEVRIAAAILLERAVSFWRERYPRVDAVTSLVARPPQHALRTAAEGAGLLVVGGRRLGDVLGFRLGPVSEAMVRDAPCPVAIVRPRR